MLAQKLGFVAMLAVAVLLAAVPANATALLPNTTVGPIPPIALMPLSGTIEATQTATIPTTGGDSFTVTEAAVLTAGGTYDFLYQVKNNSPSDTLKTIDGTNFGAYTTNVYTAVSSSGLTGTNPFAAPTVSPLAYPATANRNAGPEVTFGFGLLGVGSLPAGYTSDILEVATNATSYNGNGTVGVFDGGGATALNFLEPAAAPEPSRLAALAGLLAMGGLGFVWRRKR
jgi:hypothetical protein